MEGTRAAHMEGTTHAHQLIHTDPLHVPQPPPPPPPTHTYMHTHTRTHMHSHFVIHFMLSWTAPPFPPPSLPYSSSPPPHLADHILHVLAVADHGLSIFLRYAQLLMHLYAAGNLHGSRGRRQHTGMAVGQGERGAGGSIQAMALGQGERGAGGSIQAWP